MIRGWLWAWLSAGVAMVSLRQAAPVYACTPPVGGVPYFTPTEHTQAATMVVEGVVTVLSTDPFPHVATIRVAQYLKGGSPSGPNEISVAGYGSSSICLSEVYVGDHLIFYIVDDGAGNLRALYLSQFDAVAPVDNVVLSDIVAASGQEPIVLESVETIQSDLATQVVALTLTPAALPTPTPIGLTPSPVPFPPPYLFLTPTPYFPAPPVPTSSPTYVFTSLYSLGLLALGGAMGLSVGLVLGLFLGRRR